MPTLRVFSYKLQLSRSTLLVLLTGLSLTVLLAGYFLNKRRRRYRAVSTSSGSSQGLSNASHGLQRSSTFRTNATPFNSVTSSSVRQRFKKLHLFASHSLSDASEDEEFVEATDMPGGAHHKSHSLSSGSSSDSFHSTVDTLLEATQLLSHNHLYRAGLEQVSRGLVRARTMRTAELLCSSDVDFLAKLYCVRLAFDELVAVPTNKNYFQEMGKELMADFLVSTGTEPSLFRERFDSLLDCLMDEKGWILAEEELRQRKVVCMNVYDIALDFILLDAFTDLENPPSTVVAVLQNRWITDGMKKSALSAAVWSLLKAKRSMLKNKNGFMGHFYLLSEVLTPVMAWGFLGTDNHLKQQCHQLKGTITHFLQAIFSLEAVRYTSVNSLADDILTLAQHTAGTMTLS